MLDRENNDTTKYKTSSYATTHIPDETAALDAIKLILGDKLVIFGSNGSGSIDSGRIAYSIDNAATWTVLPIATLNVSDSAYGNGRYAGIVNTQGKYPNVITSPDGISWSVASIPNNGYSHPLYNISFGNGIFTVAASSSNADNGNPNFAYSTNCLDWGTVKSNPYIFISRISFGNSIFLGAENGYAANKIMYSTNGSNWQPNALPSILSFPFVIYGNGKFLALSSTPGSSGCRCAGCLSCTCPDPTTCSGCSGSTECRCPGGRTCICATGCTGCNSSTGCTCVKNGYLSTDGISWSPITVPIGVHTGAYGNGKFVAMNRSEVVVSTDGITWSKASLPFQAGWKVIYADNRFIAMGSNISIYSTDGVNWYQLILPNGYWTTIVKG